MNKKAFTILELLGAILVISIGVLTAYGVVQRIITYTIDSSDRITAAYLAKEGVELVRNIRDKNWVANLSWNQGLSQDYWEIDYDDPSLFHCVSCTGASTDFNYLRSLKNSASPTYNYTYNYTSGTNSKFKRKISITPDGADKIKIIVDVFWSKRGQTHSISVQENIYDWK